jgi:hypothetical protein
MMKTNLKMANAHRARMMRASDASSEFRSGGKGSILLHIRFPENCVSVRHTSRHR